MSESITCQLCFNKSSDVTVRLAWYRGEEKEPVQAIDRCRDTEACRRRVEERGEAWPLYEPGTLSDMPA